MDEQPLFTTVFAERHAQSGEASRDDAVRTKTVTMPGGCSLAQVGTLSFLAGRGDLKGITVFRRDPQLAAVVIDDAAQAWRDGPVPTGC